jgi:molybdenum cofactor synthesis domain-containing protein
MNEDALVSKAPTAAIMIIGDEILSGRTKDTNTHTIARFLASLGIDLIEIRMVRDDQMAIVETMNTLRSQFDYLITTGGIGPTHDDITADCLAKAFGVALEENPEAVLLLTQRAAAAGVSLNANSLRMARIPEGARLIKNPISAAPGIHMENVFVLAGVPKIMEAMLDDVGPYLKTGSPIHSKSMTLNYIGESWAADALREIADQYQDLSLGSYPFGLYSQDVYGTELVVRGRDYDLVMQATKKLRAALGPVLEKVLQKNQKAEILCEL